MEGIGTTHCLGARLHHNLGDPLCCVGRHVGELFAAILPEEIEKAPQRRLVTTGSCPDEPTRVVVDNDGQVAVAALVADLVDADAAQPRQAVDLGVDVVLNPCDDRPNAAPGDPHELDHRRLRALNRQPGHLVVERPRVTSAVSCPRDLGRDHPVRSTAHSRNIGLEITAQLADVERSPTAATFTPVVATAPSTASPTAPSGALRGAHGDHEHPFGLVELDAFDDGSRQTQQPLPYACVPHPVCSLLLDRQTAQKSRKRAGCARG